MIISSREFQELANRHEGIEGIADAKYVFDVNDVDDCSGVYMNGFLDGWRTTELLVKKIAEREKSPTDSGDIVIVQVRFPEYVDDDGIAFFVGSEAEVRARIEALPVRDVPIAINVDSDDEFDEVWG